MRPGSVLAFALVFAGGSGAALAADPPPRLGSITESDGGLLPGWLSGSKGSLLQVAPGEPATPDVAEAIRHYEALLAYARDPATRAEALRRAAYLRVRVGDGADGIDRDSLEAALALYDRLFAAYPDVAGNDRALYQQARALHLLGRTDDAAESLATLVARYPQSERHADAAFRAGELFYATDQPGRAASAYDAMLADDTASPDLRRLASYKLGWARLRNGEPDAAVAAFVPVIDEALAGDDDDRFHGAVLDDLPPEQRDIAGDALRGISLAFLRAGSVAQVDPSAAVAGRIDARAALYHSALAALMLERERYTDAATTFAAFAGSRSAHPLAAAFQDRAVRAYEAGGFVEPAMAARAELARRFHPDGPYWEGREADAAFGERFRTHVATLARHHHAMAQELADTDGAGAERFLIAADWYRELIALLPADGERVAEARLHRADALLDGGDLPGAVAQYRALAFEHAPNPHAAEAALAAVQTQQRIAGETPEDARAAALDDAIALALQLAEAQPEHPEREHVLLRAAENAYALADWERARTIAGRVRDAEGAATPLRTDAAHLVADARFEAAQWAEAETAYLAVRGMLPAGDERHERVTERAAVAVYRQAEAARDRGEPVAAAGLFARVGDIAPDTPLRADADYDAAASYAAAERWGEAVVAFEAFRARHAGHELAPDADKWLVTAFEALGRPGSAAVVYERIAGRAAPGSAERREAQWAAASGYDEAGDTVAAERAYTQYAGQWQRPLDRAQKARERVAHYAEAVRGDRDAALRWQREIIAAHGAAGRGASDYSALLAARAHLALGRHAARRAAGMPLRHPIGEHLAARKRRVDEAIGALERAAASGFDEVVTAASYATAEIYRDLAADLLASAPPPDLDGAALMEYELLLEDRAYPLEEQAIALHETNLGRLGDGFWDRWIRRSATALTELVPARYGKHERREDQYASLQ